MHFSRRTVLKGLVGGCVTAPLLRPLTINAAPTAGRGPRRVVFFLQNHGFCPLNAHPETIPFGNGEGVKSFDSFQDGLDRLIDEPLKDHKLPAHIDPLEPIKDLVTIVQGLNGKHVVPYHGGPYGALGGFRKLESGPLGETIDCALARTLPAVVPLLGLGWTQMDRMQSTPVRYASSGWGAQMPAPMYCNPSLAFENLFGVAAKDTSRREFEADTGLFGFVREDAERLNRKLSPAEQAKFMPYLEGFEETSRQRERLLAMSDKLLKHTPKITEQFTKPRFELDWWEASLDVGISALRAGVTNVMTIAAGLCNPSGSWNGLKLKKGGHSIGHTNMETDEDWLILRRYNMKLLLRIVRALEAEPEGDGTMMDNTLIVYTSDNAESQHCKGDRWPYLLIGNFGGTIRTGRYLHYPLAPHQGSRTINALYCSLLHAAGGARDHFNLDGKQQGLDKLGPLPEVLA